MRGGCWLSYYDLEVIVEVWNDGFPANRVYFGHRVRHLEKSRPLTPRDFDKCVALEIEAEAHFQTRMYFVQIVVNCRTQRICKGLKIAEFHNTCVFHNLVRGNRRVGFNGLTMQKYKKYFNYKKKLIVFFRLEQFFLMPRDFSYRLVYFFFQSL